MDDESDGAVSRAPELEDLVALCRSLNREGVRYLLIGGFAVILHGFVRRWAKTSSIATSVAYAFPWLESGY